MPQVIASIAPSIERIPSAACGRHQPGVARRLLIVIVMACGFAAAAGASAPDHRCGAAAPNCLRTTLAHGAWREACPIWRDPQSPRMR